MPSITGDLVAANLELNRREVREKRVRLASAPLQVNIELTGICNIVPPCLFCTGKNFGHDYAPLNTAYLDKYASILERCEHVNEDSFGEPLSHPALVATARRYITNGQRFSFVCNGLLLSPDKADKLAALGPRLGIHVSFNAASDDIFFKLTGKKFAKVVENVRYYVASYRRQNDGADPDLIFTFIVMKINRHEVVPFLRLARELGGRALLASLHDRPSVPLGKFGYDFVYEEEMLTYDDLVRVGTEAKAVAAEIGLKVALQWDAAVDSTVHGFAEPGVDTRCLVPWRYMFIQEHTQKVFGCPYHRDAHGDLTKASLEEIWNGPEAVELRTSLARGEVPKYCKDHSAGCPLVMAERNAATLEQIEDSVRIGENDFTHCVSGWHHLERVPYPIRWTSPVSEFLIRDAGRPWLCIEAVALGRKSVQGRVEMDGADLGAFDVGDQGWQTLWYRLPAADARGQVRRGRILTLTPWSPAPTGESGGDTRKLGIAVRRIWTESARSSSLVTRLKSLVRRSAREIAAGPRP
jgi:MoaA/NifB/PqqE/SkfB family radical SAM enzyme